jgi:hypothetical protein
VKENDRALIINVGKKEIFQRWRERERSGIFEEIQLLKSTLEERRVKMCKGSGRILL